ncbi:MAG: histidine kinase [Trebonia sp.]|uniref:sensor histidine kinase n=1 Tax=Trebonia sp. TaxID=2767075 RepID=UPI003BB1DDDE
MRSDRALRRFLDAGWLVSIVGMLVAGRMWQLHLREAEQRAEEAERTRDEVALRKAVEERLRIARELHDSLTHSISVIHVQAGVAAHLARKRGEEVPAALAAIQEASADASRELRATLGVLRASDDSDCSGLRQLDALIARAQAAGLPVTVTVGGTERQLTPDVDQAAYRIVQEALTNVTRHAGQTCTTVHLQYGPGLLTVQVDDDGARNGGSGGGGAPAPQPTSGMGLIGMRERVSALGGSLDAGPMAGGGFRVRAELPARAAS